MSRSTINRASDIQAWSIRSGLDQSVLPSSANNAIGSETKAVKAKVTKQESDQRFTNRVNSLGIPVDNLSSEQTLESVFELIEQYEKDKTPKLVATLNVDFLVNSLGYRFDQPRHPELLNILRQADIVTADGFPIVLLSRLSGFPLKERVTGADLAPDIARVAAEKEKSIYFLGGAGDSAQKAAKLLQKENPRMRIAGVSAPYVAIEGEKLATWDKDDLRTVNHINRSGADILFIGLGNPKQELWFARNKYRLNVPVSIGIGGTFSFITGEVKRAPKWIQRLNMEWLFRISQDPGRLIKRYLVGSIKFGFLALPLAWTSIKSMWKKRLRSGLSQALSTFQGKTHLDSNKDSEISDQSLPWNIHWASREDALKTLRLPERVSRGYFEKVVLEIHADVLTNRVIYTYMIDFSKVKYFSMGANEAFCELNRMFKSDQAEGLLIDLPKSLKKRLANSRVIDCALSNIATSNQMQESIIDSQDRSSDTRISLANKKPGYLKSQFKTYTVGKTCFSYFSGDISGEELEKTGFEDSLLNVADTRDCIIDLRRAANIDSAALATMYRLAQAQKRGEIRPIRLSGVNPVIRQMISVVGLDKEFICLNDALFFNCIFASSND